MSDFRKLAHLFEQLGDELFQVLIDSGNTGKVKEFCRELVDAALPTEMTVGGRTYDILGFLREGEDVVKGGVMVDRAKELSADLGQEECEHFLAHQSDIPVALREKVAFVFTNWRHPGGSESVAYVCWGGGRWVQGWCWRWLGGDWNGRCRVLRRKSK